MRDLLKRMARAAALVAVTPALLSYAVRSRLVGRDRALADSSQAFALLPGLSGQYLRRAFLSRVLAECAPTCAVEFGTLFSQAGARIGENVYIGPRCHIGLAHIERDVLLAAGVHVPSGPHTHGTASGIPIRDQPGTARAVRIGAGAWIGSGAVILANVGRDTIVGAGAVVTQPLPDGVIAAGVPARVVRRRDDPVMTA